MVSPFQGSKHRTLSADYIYDGHLLTFYVQVYCMITLALHHIADISNIFFITD